MLTKQELLQSLAQLIDSVEADNKQFVIDTFHLSRMKMSLHMEYKKYATLVSEITERHKNLKLPPAKFANNAAVFGAAVMIEPQPQVPAIAANVVPVPATLRPIFTGTGSAPITAVQAQPPLKKRKAPEAAGSNEYLFN
jgi:hypothetical protein